MAKEDNSVEVGKVFLDIGDGGISFTVLNCPDIGARIKVTSSHFGVRTNGMDIPTDAKSLKALGEMFLKAAEEKFQRTYSYAAKVYDPSLYNHGVCSEATQEQQQQWQSQKQQTEAPPNQQQMRDKTGQE